MPTEEEIAAAKTAADDAAAAEAAEKDAAEAKELGLGDKGKEAIKRERDARKAAEKLATDHAAELATLRKEREEADAAKARADEEAAERNGEHEKLAIERGEKLKAKDAEIKARDERIERLEKLLTPEIDKIKGSLPKEALTKFPADAGVDDQYEWLTERAELVKSLVPGDPDRPKFPATPRPRDVRPEDAQEAEKQRLRQTANYGI